MKRLLTKSDENYESFHILKDAGKISSSVHCAYYSIFQLSIYSLCKFFGYQYKQLVGLQGDDSHNFIINKMGEEIEGRDYFDSVDYLENMNELKMKRKKADYWKDPIINNEVNDVEKCLDLNVRLIKNKYI